MPMIRGHGKHANSCGIVEGGVSLQPNPNSYKESNSAQDRCHSVQEPETWKTSFWLSDFRGDVQQTRFSQVVWIHLAQKRDQRWAIVYKVMNIWVS
jgi:hypothetical protein